MTANESETLPPRVGVPQVALMLGIPSHSVIAMCRSGLLQSESIDGELSIPREGIMELIEPPMTRDQRRSLFLSTTVSAKIEENPEGAFAIAKQNMQRLLDGALPRVDLRYTRRWMQLIDDGVPAVTEMLRSESMLAREMRQHTPFAGVLTEEERMNCLQAFLASGESSRVDADES